MIGRRRRRTLPTRCNYTNNSKKDGRSIPQWGGNDHKFFPPDPGKGTKSQKPLRQASPTTRANYLRIINGDINEEECFNTGTQTPGCLILVLLYIHLFPNSLKDSEKATKRKRKNQGRTSLLFLCFTRLIILYEVSQSLQKMAGKAVEDLVVHLEKSMDLSNMEQGIKLVGTALVNKTLNKWGGIGEIEIKWVKDKTFIIIVNDESTTAKIIDQVPWAVMKQNFSVKRWPKELALEEIDMNKISFWIQIRGVPPYLSTEENIKRLASKIGEVKAMEDLAKTRGFLRVKVEVDTGNPLTTGCWLPRGNNNESLIEFRYERL
ncbi:hypothetical protein D8674_037825 [Pyrus ussuriensis x Pyrus communis]|uniref:Uncharacterized protein n=1 Tax=Pyrus ussuriensis x Pyrus communis TaxID=2448454 RepID=A0A5N5HCK5_9ROSA|nr:hypothetical protein D8674_037825 [Pyrus ussuriensis x Pyrus communis]